jgi:GSH-dependent disulfide-bond oxidoreductase
MIELYTWMTDNGYKARHMMEESGLEYTLKPINVKEKEQFDPEYLKISPHHKIPAIIDDEGPGGETISLFESGAILKYIGSKMANPLYPSDPMAQLKVDQWLFFGSAQFTTLSQQYGFFMIRNPEDVPKGKKHYDGVMRDMFGMLDKQLSEREYIAGDFSVADISMFSDAKIYGDNQWIGFGDYPNFKRWHDAILARPAVDRAWVPFG